MLAFERLKFLLELLTTVHNSIRRVPTGQGKLEKVKEFVWSGKVSERSGENIIFEKSGKMILDHGHMESAGICDFLHFQLLKSRQICCFS